MTFDLDYTQELRRTSAAVCRCVVVRLDPLSLNLDKFFRGYLKPASSDIGGALASLASAALYVLWGCSALLLLRLVIRAALVSPCLTVRLQGRHVI
jgi:hypothetical protein